MNQRKSKARRELSEEEIQRLVDECEAELNMTDEQWEERNKKWGEWLLKNNKIECGLTLSRDTFNLVHRAHWFTDLNYDEFVDYATRQFAMKVLKANGCDIEKAALGDISVTKSKMAPLEIDEDEKIESDTVYSYLGVVDRTYGGKYVVMIPDLNVAAYGDSEVEAFVAAEGVLTSILYSLKARSYSLPEPSDHTDMLEECQGWGFVYSLPLSIFQSIEEYQNGTLQTLSFEQFANIMKLDI